MKGICIRKQNKIIQLSEKKLCICVGKIKTRTTCEEGRGGEIGERET